MDYQTPTLRKSMHACIVRALGMHIVSGRFKPEEVLPLEATLCEEYKVSLPVLREATRVALDTVMNELTPLQGSTDMPRPNK